MRRVWRRNGNYQLMTLAWIATDAGNRNCWKSKWMTKLHTLLLASYGLARCLQSRWTQKDYRCLHLGSVVASRVLVILGTSRQKEMPIDLLPVGWRHVMAECPPPLAPTPFERGVIANDLFMIKGLIHPPVYLHFFDPTSSFSLSCSLGDFHTYFITTPLYFTLLLCGLHGLSFL